MSTQSNVVEPGFPIPTSVQQVITQSHLSYHPQRLNCPQCGQSVMTVVQQKRSSAQWIFCGIIAITGLVAGCCLVPFCVDAFRDHEHRCPNCRAVIAIKSLG